MILFEIFFGGADGSNPSLLKVSAVVFLCALLQIGLDHSGAVLNAAHHMTGGNIMNSISWSAVTFAVSKSAISVLIAVAAGLAANGVAPHL